MCLAPLREVEGYGRSQLKAARAIVVKAAVAYKAAYAPIAGTIIEVDTPGLTAINPARFEYKRIRRPLYPLSEA